MKEKHKKLTEELSTLLWQETINFMANNLEDKEDTSDLINLILSSHLTSLCNLMQWFSEEYPQMKNKVNEFLEGLLNFISNAHPIKDMEIIRERNK
jgi:hypothetical protein